MKEWGCEYNSDSNKLFEYIYNRRSSYILKYVLSDIYICGYVKSKQGCSISLGEKNNSITFLFMAFYKEYHNSACFLVN